MDPKVLLDLADLPHLKHERLALRLLPVADLEPILLPLVNSDAGLAYRSVHGPVVTAKEPVVRLLDTVLEKAMPEAFDPLPARDHWDTEEALPAGPGPFGSGLLALGSVDEPAVLRVTDWQPPGPDALFGDSLPEPETTTWSIEYDEEAENRSPAAWLELTGPLEALRGYLYRRFHRDVNDLALSWDKDLERTQRIEYAAEARRFLDGVLTVFPPEKSRYFLGHNAGWDRHDEDYLAHDTVIGVVGDEYLLLMYLYYSRWYG
ncbi:hypothetical protein [Actinomadura viridis]|uniref:Uncharacterized protein n=1 Tax=Actinomadura viridis TaxID=58110 RepID=A0A931DLX8_9ACTN|nr:hypothetical protein [Actinomadura viridis]MBG6092395.1 hypothetical protein [Actinomadura viridis]